MRILLDTHCWLWFNSTPERFSARTRRLLEEPANELFLSVASVWEIGIKVALGKLQLPEPIDDYVTSRLSADGIVALPISLAHVLRAGRLPPLHRDPFDRMLVAQAQLEELRLLTADKVLAKYDVELLKA